MSEPRDFEPDYEYEEGVATDVAVEPPKRYRVLLHNDDYTTRDFVVDVLKGVFHKNDDDAVRIMLHVHERGVGVAGIYPYEVAETKIDTSETLARAHGFPLRLSMEPIDG